MKRRSFIKQGARLLLALIVALALTAAAQVEPTVRVSEHPEFGEILVDHDGNSLYLFTRDEEGESACTGDCAEAWPPVLVEGAVGFGESIELDLLGTTEREDGTTQLTYAGNPLYYFARDEEPGDASGHGANEVWFLVSPAGEAVEIGSQSDADDEASEETDEGQGEETDSQDDLASLMDEGTSVFNSNCASCHGRSGTDTAGGAAKLAGNRSLGNGGRAARQVLFGSQYMPAFGDRLSDHQVAAVVTYIRNSWGNEFGVFTEEEVTEERRKFE